MAVVIASLPIGMAAVGILPATVSPSLEGDERHSEKQKETG